MTNRKLSLKELDRIGLEGYKNLKKSNFSVFLENVRSLHNVGSAFRTCDAFRAETLYLAGFTGSPPHREIQKTALGATESVSWLHHPTPLVLLKSLKAEGKILIAIEQTRESLPLEKFIPSPKGSYVLLFGNEIDGVSQEAIDLCENCLEIPQSGTKHSLNLSVCLGISLYTLIRASALL